MGLTANFQSIRFSLSHTFLEIDINCRINFQLASLPSKIITFPPLLSCVPVFQFLFVTLLCGTRGNKTISKVRGIYIYGLCLSPLGQSRARHGEAHVQLQREQKGGHDGARGGSQRGCKRCDVTFAAAATWADLPAESQSESIAARRICCAYRMAQPLFHKQDMR